MSKRTISQELPAFSLIITVLNEASTMTTLLESIAQLTYQPQEIIIVDGGSSDGTVPLIKRLCKHYQWSATFCQVLTQKGNRSVGRNVAIATAHNEWIAITDAGCRLEPDWLGTLARAAQEHHHHTQVLAGYYASAATSALQIAMTPFFLVMPDQVDPTTFLPATRSMALTKTVWQRYGGFPEEHSDNEDYVFAKRLEKHGEPIVFVAKAIVWWQPPTSLSAFAKTIFRFARGDIAAGEWRPKVGLLFTRYTMGGLGLIALWLMYGWRIGVVLMILGGTLYSLWAISKLYRYTKKEWYWVPLLHYLADFSVLAGSINGYLIWLTSRLVSRS